MASFVKSVCVKKVFDTPARLSGMCRLEMCVIVGSERRALHHGWEVKSERCSILWRGVMGDGILEGGFGIVRGLLWAW